MSMMLIHASGATISSHCRHFEAKALQEASPLLVTHVNSLAGVGLLSYKLSGPCCKGGYGSFPSRKDHAGFVAHRNLDQVGPTRWMCLLHDSSASDVEYRSSRNIAVSIFRRYRNFIDRGGGVHRRWVNAYALGCTDETLRKELVDMKESGVRIEALQAFGGSTSLKSKIILHEPVSDRIMLQWKGFCTLIANAYFVKGMAWLPVKTLQLEQLAVLGSAEEPSVVASRMRLVFTTLEVVSPQWPKA